jgi:RTX calcium-binding nonapeptide repeat (4 copies)
MTPIYGITTASPGFLQAKAVTDARLINYAVGDDAVVAAGRERVTVGNALKNLSTADRTEFSATFGDALDLPSPTFLSESVGMFNANYYQTGTSVVLKVPGHPTSLQSALSLFVKVGNGSTAPFDAHDFSVYKAGISALSNQNPLNLVSTLDPAKRASTKADTLFGSSGNDRIDGKGGIDTVYGRDGADTFVFSSTLSASKNFVTVADWQTGDSIEVSRKVFSAYRAPVNSLPDSDFLAGIDPHASTASQHFLYDTGTGILSYDADGFGSKSAPVVFAKLVGVDGRVPDLLAASIHVV